ncbi:DUF4157 domain-containing protein [Streptomyces sp. NPDC001851]|uniref:eCIS core domain-containing protein n=1 Tax=Streptomyces sp. NPDC001851 TaxID=3154529 RepID=UPI003334A509
MGLQGTIGNAAVVQRLRTAGHLAEEEGEQHTADHEQGESEHRPAVQRSAVHDVLRGPGQPLDDATRTDMEARLGTDFSDVRIHSGAAARASAAEIGARAYTSGSHVVIGAGGGDRHTLAHELTHVIQQRTGPVAGTDNGAGLKVSDPSDRFEREAEANARRVMSAGPSVQRAAPPAPGEPSHARPAVQRVVESGNRPAITHQDPNDDWFADNTTAARADGLVLSGHGGWERVDGYFRVPRGTRVHFYTVHGQTVPDDLGGDVEQGNNQGGSVEQGQRAGAARTVVGGRSVSNYRISYPAGLTIRGNPVVATPVAGGYDVELDPGTPAATVIRVATLTDQRLAGHSIVFDGDVLLSDILHENMGDVHFAACRFVETGRPGTRNQGDGLFNP